MRTIFAWLIICTQIAFLAARVMYFINWEWRWVFLPLILGGIGWVLIIFLCFIAALTESDDDWLDEDWDLESKH